MLAAQARLSLHLSKYHIVGNHVSLLINVVILKFMTMANVMLMKIEHDLFYMAAVALSLYNCEAKKFKPVSGNSSENFR